jgi:hypothetical protein
MPEPHGYTLMLACTSCGLKKRIRHFPTQAAFQFGDILTSAHIAIYEKGCLRCGVCRFEVLTIPPAPVPSPGPVGWAKRPG